MITSVLRVLQGSSGVLNYHKHTARIKLCIAKNGDVLTNFQEQAIRFPASTQKETTAIFKLYSESAKSLILKRLESFQLKYPSIQRPSPIFRRECFTAGPSQV